MTTAEILATARTLRPEEQLFLIDSLCQMLDEPDPAMSQAWAIEAGDRLAAFDRGELQAQPIDELFTQLRAA